MVVALGMLSPRRRCAAVAGVGRPVAFAALGVIGQAVTYHFLTDAVGSVLLGTSLVCIAAVVYRSLRRRVLAP